MRTDSIAKRIATGLVLVGSLLLTPLKSLGTSGVCFPVHLKPTHHICGITRNIIAEPVEDAVVYVRQDEREIASAHTGPDGKFAFGEIEPGAYEVEVRAKPYLPFQFSITVVKGGDVCDRKLDIRLFTGGYVCNGAVQSVKRLKTYH